MGGGATRAHATLPWACTCSDQQQVAGLQEHQQRQCSGARRTGSPADLCDVATMGRRWDGRRSCRSTHDVAIHSHAKHAVRHVCTATQASHVLSRHGAVGGPCTWDGRWWDGWRGYRSTNHVAPRREAGTNAPMWLCHGTRKCKHHTWWHFAYAGGVVGWAAGLQAHKRRYYHRRVHAQTTGRKAWHVASPYLPWYVQ